MKLIITLFLLITFISFSQDFWKQSNGPYGGTVTQIASNTNDDIFIGTNMGIYRLMNNGENWERLNICQNHYMVCSIEIDLRGNLYVVLSNTEPYVDTWDGICINRSLDNGETWETIFNSTTTDQHITSEIISNSNGDIFFGTMGGDIYYSRDKGVSWDIKNSGLLDGVVECLAINSTGDLFAGMFQYADHPDNAIGGIYSSIDNGNSWTKIENNLRSNIWIMCIKISADGTMLAETNGLLYRSIDNGQNWDVINNNLPLQRVHSITTNENGDIFVGPFQSCVYWSSNNGDSWTKINNGLMEESVVWSLATNSEGVLFAGTEDQGLFRLSGIQENWVEVNNGLANLNVYFLGQDLQGKIYCGTSGGVFSSVNNGQGWNKLPNNFGFIKPYGPSNGIFAVDPNGKVYLGNDDAIHFSIDKGTTWSEINYKGLPESRPGSGQFGGILEALKINSGGDLFLQATGWNGSGIYRSSDGGDNWLEIFTEFYQECYTIGPNDYIFVASTDIYRSSNNGDSFEIIEVTTNKMFTNIGINSIGTIFAFAQDDLQNYLFTSTDNGDTWSDKSNFLPNWYFGHSEDYSVKCLYFDNDNNIFVGTCRNGIFFSSDNGNSWSSVTEGLPKLDSLCFGISSIVIDSDGFLYAGTDGNSVYKILNPILSATDDLMLPTSYYLSQNYPNPFNPNTMIKYSIPNQSYVTLKVFDLLGSAVTTLVNKEQSQGNYEVAFDGSELTSGIYFYRFQAGDPSTSSGQGFVETKKMVLLK